MTSHEGKWVIGLVQYCAVNKSPYGQASMTGHEGKWVTCSVQYCAVNKSPVDRPAQQVMRENRLQVQYSIVL